MSEQVSLTVRVPKDLHARLQAAAGERIVSMTWLTERALEDFLSRLIPASELKLTRDRGEAS